MNCATRLSEKLQIWAEEERNSRRVSRSRRGTGGGDGGRTGARAREWQGAMASGLCAFSAPLCTVRVFRSQAVREVARSWRFRAGGGLPREAHSSGEYPSSSTTAAACVLLGTQLAVTEYVTPPSQAGPWMAKNASDRVTLMDPPTGRVASKTRSVAVTTTTVCMEGREAWIRMFSGRRSGAEGSAEGRGAVRRAWTCRLIRSQDQR